MADFFGGLNSSNVRFTDARINGDGPLPTNLSGPEGINGDPDGRYNFNDSLLSGITPYAFGQGRMGSDRNYQQIPHRKQFPVPRLFLPEHEWDTGACCDVSHPIDMGDLVFIVNAQYKNFLLNGNMGKHLKHAEETTMPQYNAFCNVCTVNYILAGISNYVERVLGLALQRRGEVPIADLQQHAWYQLMRCLRIDEDLEVMQDRVLEHVVNLDAASPQMLLYIRLMLKFVLRKVIRDCIKPVGICSTSEKQGGQHEVGFKPVQAAASFFVTMTVDGQNRDLVNIWRHVDVEGGDQLTLHLEWCNSAQGSTHYVLNHYYKGWVAKTVKFPSYALGPQMRAGRFQLVPRVFRLLSRDADKPEENAWYKEEWSNLARRMYYLPARGNVADVFDRVLAGMVHGLKDDHEFGFWHIGQSYTKVKNFSDIAAPTDDMAMLQGQLLQINFAPVWSGRTTGEFMSVCKELLDTDRDAAAVTTWVGKYEGRNLLSLMWCDLLYMSLFAPYNSMIRLRPVIIELSRFNNIGLVFPFAPAAQNALAVGASAALLTSAALQSGGAPGDVAPPAKRFKKTAQEAAAGNTSAQEARAQEARAQEAAAANTSAQEAAAAEAASDWDFEKELQDLVASDASQPDAQKTGQQKPKAKAKS
jgi:hypothetical protein